MGGYRVGSSVYSRGGGSEGSALWAVPQVSAEEPSPALRGTCGVLDAQRRHTGSLQVKTDLCQGSDRPRT